MNSIASKNRRPHLTLRVQDSIGFKAGVGIRNTLDCGTELLKPASGRLKALGVTLAQTWSSQTLSRTRNIVLCAPDGRCNRLLRHAWIQLWFQLRLRNHGKRLHLAQRLMMVMPPCSPTAHSTPITWRWTNTQKPIQITARVPTPSLNTTTKVFDPTGSGRMVSMGKRRLRQFFLVELCSQGFMRSDSEKVPMFPRSKLLPMVTLMLFLLLASLGFLAFQEFLPTLQHPAFQLPPSRTVQAISSP